MRRFVHIILYEPVCTSRTWFNNMYVYICTYIHFKQTNLQTYTFIRTDASILRPGITKKPTYAHIYSYVHIHTVFVCVYIYKCINIYVCLSIFIYIIYTYIYTHTCIHIYRCINSTTMDKKNRLTSLAACASPQVCNVCLKYV